jgi:hypothetical protein
MLNPMLLLDARYLSICQTVLARCVPRYGMAGLHFQYLCVTALHTVSSYSYEHRYSVRATGCRLL